MIRCIKGLDVEHMLLPCLVYAIKQKMVSLGDRMGLRMQPAVSV